MRTVGKPNLAARIEPPSRAARRSGADQAARSAGSRTGSGPVPASVSPSRRIAFSSPRLSPRTQRQRHQALGRRHLDVRRLEPDVAAAARQLLERAAAGPEQVQSTSM
jgi:hypothetical protein